MKPCWRSGFTGRCIAETVGLGNALRVIRNHPETDQVGIRVDSGDISEQTALYFQEMHRKGISPRLLVFEDEVTPPRVREILEHFQQATGQKPTMLFPGAGGYWWRLVHRDTVAAVCSSAAPRALSRTPS